MLNMEVVYVTVGTTKFDALLTAITSDAALEVLKHRDCHKLIIQYGAGVCPVDADYVKKKHGIEIDMYDFKFEAVRTDILNASLVIGHAGAGTCIDILQHNKPALIVINDNLMDNHQTELAIQLSEDGYIYHCEVRQLIEHLSKLDIKALKPYKVPEENMRSLVNYMHELLN